MLELGGMVYKAIFADKLGLLRQDFIQIMQAVQISGNQYNKPLPNINP